MGFGECLRSYRNNQDWEKYLLILTIRKSTKKGLKHFMDDAQPTLIIKLTLPTFPDMVESEQGVSIHEKRIIAQRGTKVYRGYIPINV